MNTLMNFKNTWLTAAFVLVFHAICGLSKATGGEGMPGEFTHAGLRKVLATHASTNGVNYAALKADPAELNAYLDECSHVTKSRFEAWPKAAQLAFLVNLYNATTLRLVAKHYPVSSIRQIGGLLGNPWKLKEVRIHGDLMTLDELEHDVIRKRYAEPRIHFAVVCAAKGCPTLRLEPYEGEKLDLQLEDQARGFMATAEKNRLDASRKTLWLSPIFDWYRSDFEAAAGTLQSYVQPRLPEDKAKLLLNSTWKIRFTTYDWSLNDWKPLRKR
ncbi:MAG: DUF547 domain-containing protein [Verrucomicrobia bacterium]|nr:DUF547 domain-containing protein [Verrucomicrobiota bacterium]